MATVICFNSLYVYLFISLFSILMYSFVDQQMSKWNKKSQPSQQQSQQSQQVQQVQQLQQLQQQQQQLQQQLQQQQSQQQLSDRLIKNVLSGPTRIYPGGRLDVPAYDDYQLIGFLFNTSQRFPLYGRPRYPGKTDKYEYYLVDESRNKLKIPITTKNYNELYDGDSITIPELEMTLTVKLYEFEKLRYDPRLF